MARPQNQVHRTETNLRINFIGKGKALRQRTHQTHRVHIISTLQHHLNRNNSKRRPRCSQNISQKQDHLIDSKGETGPKRYLALILQCEDQGQERVFAEEVDAEIGGVLPCQEGGVQEQPQDQQHPCPLSVRKEVHRNGQGQRQYLSQMVATRKGRNHPIRSEISLRNFPLPQQQPREILKAEDKEQHPKRRQPPHLQTINQHRLKNNRDLPSADETSV